MDNQPCKKGPAKLLATIVEAFAPLSFRAAITSRLFDNFETNPQYCMEAARDIRLTLASNSRKAFNVRRFLGDVMGIFIGFAGFATASIGSLIAIMAVAIPALIWRDAHTHNVELTPGETATDGFALGMTILVSQLLLFFLWGSLSTARAGLLMGTGMSMVFVSGWRLIFRMNEPRRDPALKPYRSAWRMTLLWLIGAASLLAADRQLLSSNSHLFDFVLGAVPFPLFNISLALRAGTMGSLLWGPVIQTTLFMDVKKEAFLAKIKRLFRTAFSGFWSLFFERLLFVWIAFPLVLVLARVALGRTPVESVNWILWFSTAGGFAVLCKTWTEVKKFNDRVAAELQKEIVSPKEEAAV
jgi:hypothetical protein